MDMRNIYINAESIQKRAYKMRFAMRITERELALINYVLTTASKADTLEIARCGECKHYMDNNICPLSWECFAGNDFCSHGERRE